MKNTKSFLNASVALVALLFISTNISASQTIQEREEEETEKLTLKVQNDQKRINEQPQVSAQEEGKESKTQAIIEQNRQNRMGQ
jgi:hypothetical protein